MKKVLLFAAAMTLVGMGGASADSNYSAIDFAQSQAAMASGANNAAMREAAENVKAYDHLLSLEAGKANTSQEPRGKRNRPKN